MINHLEHSKRVADLSFKLATLLGLSTKKTQSIYKTALFHDLGKSKINPKILNKPEKLTLKEFEHIKKHSIYGYQIALKLGIDNLDALDILHHHENFDGTGYPMEIKGNNIPLGARIIRICDMYDALISDRPYKEKLDYLDAINVMIKEKQNFDEEIFNIFLESILDKGVEFI